jgi:hypothetical protein
MGEHGTFLRLTLRRIPVIVRTIIRDPPRLPGVFGAGATDCPIKRFTEPVPGSTRVSSSLHKCGAVNHGVLPVHLDPNELSL